MAWEGLDEAVAVADAGNFVRAAQLLGTSTSHVSRAVARLERRLDTRLFNRTTRRVELTDTGRAFIEQSRRIIQERDELLALASGAGEPQGELRLTCSTALGERFVAPIVQRFAKAHPRLSVSLDLTNRVVDLIGEGYDIGIRTGRVSDARLVSRQIASRPIETCAAPAYLDAAGTPGRIDDLDAHQCLIGTGTTWHFAEDGQPRSYTPRGRWRCNSGGVIVDAALAGMGLCQLPAFYVRQHIKAGRLRPVLASYGSAPEPVWIIYPQRRHLLLKVRNLADALEAALPRALAAD